MLRLAAAGALVIGCVAATPAEAATPPVKITRVYYDSPGSDRGGNTSLNAEFVVLKNTTKKAIQLQNWILRDKNGFKYRFPRFTLKPGKTVTVHSGKGRNTTTHLYWGRSWYVWNNTGDTAYIYRRDGNRIHYCSWGRGGVQKYC